MRAQTGWLTCKRSFGVKVGGSLAPTLSTLKRVDGPLASEYVRLRMLPQGLIANPLSTAHQSAPQDGLRPFGCSRSRLAECSSSAATYMMLRAVPSETPSCCHVPWKQPDPVAAHGSSASTDRKNQLNCSSGQLR